MKKLILLFFISLFSTVGFTQSYSLDFLASPTIVAPTIQASSLTVQFINPTSFTFSWTNGNGSSRIVLMKSGSAVNSNPIDGTTYTASTTFGSGTQIGTGNYVVKLGSGPVTVTGLTTGVAYYLAIYELNGISTATRYMITSPLIGNNAYPLSLSPIAWYDNSSSLMASDGSAWTDRMANYTVTSTGTAKPTYTSSVVNGYSTFTFDGVNDALTGAQITQIQGVSGVTYWRVIKADVSLSHSFSGSLRTENYSIYSNVANGSNTYGNTSTHDGTIYYYTVMVFDGTQSTDATKLKQWENGVQKTFVGSSFPIPTTTEGNAGSLVRIGSVAGGGIYTSGEILEAGIVNRAITGTEVNNLNAYLFQKYRVGYFYGYGDSVTAGSGASDHAHSFMGIIAATRKWYEVNHGIGGTPLESVSPPVTNNFYDIWSANVPTKTESSDRYLTIAYGLNDINFGISNPGYSPSNFATQLQTIITGILAKGWAAQDIIIVTGFHQTLVSDPTWTGYVNQAINIANVNGTRLVDFTGLLGPSDMTDSVHPNDLGHAKYATAFLAVIP